MIVIVKPQLRMMMGWGWGKVSLINLLVLTIKTKLDENHTKCNKNSINTEKKLINNN